MTSFAAFAWGVFGGGALAVVDLHAAYVRGAGALPPLYRSRGFWATRVVLAFIGGGMALAAHLAYDVTSVVLAINVGVSAPLILERLGRGVDSGLGHAPWLPGGPTTTSAPALPAGGPTGPEAVATPSRRKRARSTTPSA